jgi:hypothetical protein
MTESVNISSGGIFVRAALTVLPRQRLEAWIAWPVLLDEHIPLRLVTKGPVVRCGEAGTAMRFNKYEFRTGPVQVQALSFLTGRRSAGHANGKTSIKIAG